MLFGGGVLFEVHIRLCPLLCGEKKATIKDWGGTARWGGGGGGGESTVTFGVGPF